MSPAASPAFMSGEAVTGDPAITCRTSIIADPDPPSDTSYVPRGCSVQTRFPRNVRGYRGAMPEGDSDERSTSGPQPGESPKARVDRELIELLNGLRVILPGVQVLLAFLLTVPFSSGFERTTRTEQVLYFVSVLITVGAVAALTA